MWGCACVTGQIHTTGSATETRTCPLTSGICRLPPPRSHPHGHPWPLASTEPHPSDCTQRGCVVSRDGLLPFLGISWRSAEITFTSLWLMESGVCIHCGLFTFTALQKHFTFFQAWLLQIRGESTITGRFPPGPASSPLWVKGPGVHLLCSVLRLRVAVEENARLCPRMSTSPP